MSYREFQTTTLTPGVDPPDGCAPPWLLDPFGLAWLGGTGDAKDAVAAWAKEAIKARFPLLAPPDALAATGDERGLPRGPGESLSTYRSRLVSAWDTWQWAGTPYGLLTALRTAGYVARLQIQTGTQYTLITTPTGNPATDVVTTSLGAGFSLGFDSIWNQCAVYVIAPFPSWWGGSVPALGSDDALFVGSLVEKWKPGHVMLARLGASQGPTWDDGVTKWDDAVDWDDGTFTSWMPQRWGDGTAHWDDGSLNWK